MRKVIAAEQPSLLGTAEAVCHGEVVPDHDAEALVDALTSAMGREYSEAEGLTDRGNEIDDLIGLAAQAAASFYRT